MIEKKRGMNGLLPWMMEGVEIENSRTTPARQKRIGVGSRPGSSLMHLTNSTPTLSLCMTGRGELQGNEGEEEVEVVVR